MTHNHSGKAGRKADYWYLDRTGGKRFTKLKQFTLLAVVIVVTMLGAACCSNNNDTLQAQYQDAYGSDAARGTSDLLGTLTSTVDSTLTTTTNTLTSTTDTLLGTTANVVSATASVAIEGSCCAVYLNSTGDTLKDARVVCGTGEVLGFSLSDYSGKLSFPKQKAWNFVAVSSSNGSKWYFDNAGLPLPGGYTPRISVLPALTNLVGGGTYTISSSDAISEVRFFYSNGNVGGATPDRYGRVTAQYPVSYIAIGVKYDSSGSKWYFDRSGLPLPNGYKPTIGSAWKNQSLTLTSSDLYDKVVIYFSDYTKDSYSTNETSGLYKPFRARTADGFMVRLKSDGSKWYFDNLGLPVLSGAKWFSDMD